MPATHQPTRSPRQMPPPPLPSAKVIPIPTTRAPLDRKMLHLSLDQLVGFEGVKILANLIQEWLLQPAAKINGEKRKIKHLAAAANLYPQTVSKIMNRETMSPRMMTCIMLFKALGFTAVRFE